MTYLLPDKVKKGYLLVKVRPYIPLSLVCYSLGHHRNNCGKRPRCKRCSEQEHQGPCEKVECCLCGKDHVTLDKKCEAY